MLRRTLVLGVIAVLVSGCAGTADGSSQAGGLRVLATETFLGDIAQNVAGTRLHIDVLLPAGIDPHEFQPTPQDAIRISESQVLILNGLGYETWLTKSLEDNAGTRQTIVATTGLAANPDPSGEHPDGDPHLWMDPLKVVRYAENIRDGLTKADPAGGDVYAANAAAYAARLQELDGWIKGQVSAIPADRRQLITNHDALGYFAKAYGFQIAGLVIPSVTNEASPSAKQMAQLIDSIKQTRAPAIFLDISENQQLARQIASATGSKVVTDLYVETLSAPDGPAPTYLEMMKHDVSDIIAALK